jgi:hypothetical protein
MLGAGFSEITKEFLSVSNKFLRIEGVLCLLIFREAKEYRVGFRIPMGAIRQAVR